MTDYLAGWRAGVEAAALLGDALLRDNLTDSRKPLIVVQELTATIRALSEPEAPDGWQDISSAPRDGRDVLVYGAWEGEVSAGDGLPHTYVAARMAGTYYVRGTDQYYGEVAATHWRPLPAQPKGDAP